jgi:uncharacterized repeat protein (TIGR01451 family)
MKKLSVLLILALLLQAIFVTPTLAGGGKCIDLAIIKVDNPNPIVAGNDLTYTIHIANYGTSTASDVYVFDMYPTNSLAVQLITPSQGTVGQSLPGWVMDTLEQEMGITSTPPGFSYLTWEAGDLAAGESADLEIIATVNPNLPLPGGSPIINRALVMSNFDELFWYNNYAITFTWVSPVLPDINVDPLDIDFGPVQLGLSSAPLPVTVTNTGNADLEIGAVTFTNSLFSISSGDVSGITLLPGASQIMNLVFTPSSLGVETGTMQISSNDPDEPVVEVNLTGTGIEPTEADLEITKIADPDPVTTNANLTYTLTVTNYGPDEATGITVTDTLPAGTAYQSTSPSEGTAEHNAGVVTWTIDLLPADTSATLTIEVTAPSEAGIITNQASVSGNEIDTNTENDNVALDTTVEGEVVNGPDIQVEPPLINFGTIQLGFTTLPRTITVTNQGNEDLVLGDITVDNSQYTISGSIAGQTLIPGASASFNVALKPAFLDIQPGTLSIFSNDPDENPATVSLLGYGMYIIPPQTPSGLTPTTTQTPDGTGDGSSKFFTVDFLGEITTEPASSDGRPLNDVEAYSPDNVHLLEINAGTRAADSGNNSVTTITIRETIAPQLPENTALVGSALEFQPSGTSFNDPTTLTLGYNVGDLPESVISIGTAYYDPGSGWKYLESTSSNVVAEVGKLTSTVNHFTVFAILAQVPSESHITNQPDTPVPDVSLSASFILSNLSIATSESKTWQGFTYITRTGEDAHITVDVTNNGEKSGTYLAVLMLNGNSIDSVQFDIGAGETKSISFDVKGNEPGEYTVQIGDQYGEFTSSIWVNWWLIAGSGLFVVLLISGLVYFIFIRNRNTIKLI